jgi:hypothetical protein
VLLTGGGLEKGGRIRVYLSDLPSIGSYVKVSSSRTQRVVELGCKK